MYCLASGVLFKAPEQKTSKAGRTYSVAKIRSKMGQDTCWISVLAFSEAAQTELMRLKDGDSVSIQGELKVGVYADKQGEVQPSIEIFANEVLALRRPKKPRNAATSSPEPERQQDEAAFDDAIPF